METFLKVVFGIIIAVILCTQVVSCTECWQGGGSVVKGVFGYVCVK